MLKNSIDLKNRYHEELYEKFSTIYNQFESDNTDFGNELLMNLSHLEFSLYQRFAKDLHLNQKTSILENPQDASHLKGDNKPQASRKRRCIIS